MSKINKHVLFVCRLGALKDASNNKEARWSLDVLRNNFKKVSVTEISAPQNLYSIAKPNPDLVFLGAAPTRIQDPVRDSMHDIWLSDFFESRGLAFSGSPSQEMRQATAKQEAKRAILSAGLMTAQYFVARDGEFSDQRQIPIDFPLFLKPTNLSTGRGISADSVVHDFVSFQDKVRSISTDLKTSTLAEKYLSGREFTVALIEDFFSKKTIAMPVEIVVGANSNGDRIVSGSVKKADTEKVIAVENRKLHKELSNFAIRSFCALSGRDYGRIDLRMDDTGKIHFLEANLRPGLGGGYFVRACFINQGMEYESMIMNIVNLGLLRSASDREMPESDITTDLLIESI